MPRRGALAAIEDLYQVRMVFADQALLSSYPAKLGGLSEPLDEFRIENLQCTALTVLASYEYNGRFSCPEKAINEPSSDLMAD
jgi:hypothetical protein